MTYYMARSNLLMDRHLPRNATLSPEIPQSAFTGLTVSREAELKGIHNSILELESYYPCFTSDHPSRTPAGLAALATRHKGFGHVGGPPRFGTKAFQVPEFYEGYGGDPQCVGLGVYSSRVGRCGSEHAELRKEVWAMLLDAFGLKG